MSDYLTADQASAELAISPATLYAYVSRGLIRSEAAPGDLRARRYRAEDVQRLKERKEQRRNPAAAVEGALHWGVPVLESALTLIANGCLYYRGLDALELSSTCSIEDVAALLWTGGIDRSTALFADSVTPLSERCAALLPQVAALPVVDAFQVLLPLAGLDDLAAYDLRPAAVARTGVRILRLLVQIAARGPVCSAGIAATLQRSWVPMNPAAARVLDSALILCADHELNVSSFTARCVASAGSTPYAAVIAGLSALQGVKHGRLTERAEALLRRVSATGDPRGTLAECLRAGEPIPGFGQPLYPAGDPRGAELLRLASTGCPESPWLAAVEATVREASSLIDARPTIDFGLAALALCLGLPSNGALTLFALGRAVGWIGHAIEEYQVDRIIRPRARYVGEQPSA